MISLGILLVLLGHGLVFGSFYYGEEWGVRAIQMRTGAILTVVWGFVICGAVWIRHVSKGYDIHQVRIIGEVPFQRLGDNPLE